MSAPPPPLNAPTNSSHVVINWPLAVVIITALACFTTLAVTHVIPEDTIKFLLAGVVGLVIPLPVKRRIDP